MGEEEKDDVLQQTVCEGDGGMADTE